MAKTPETIGTVITPKNPSGSEKDALSNAKSSSASKKIAITGLRLIAWRTLGCESLALLGEKETAEAPDLVVAGGSHSDTVLTAPQLTWTEAMPIERTAKIEPAR